MDKTIVCSEEHLPKLICQFQKRPDLIPHLVDRAVAVFQNHFAPYNRTKWSSEYYQLKFGKPRTEGTITDETVAVSNLLGCSGSTVDRWKSDGYTIFVFSRLAPEQAEVIKEFRGLLYVRALPQVPFAVKILYYLDPGQTELKKIFRKSNIHERKSLPKGQTPVIQVPMTPEQYEAWKRNQ